jgi:ATP-dependent DNA ligase
MELEGIISKKLGSWYVSGHSEGWLKLKAFESHD